MGGRARCRRTRCVARRTRASAAGADSRSQGVIANLESHSWVYHGEKAGVRIFSKEADEDAAGLEREGSQASGSRATAPSTAGTGIEGRPKAKQGIRAHETLPFFRGEAFIEGSWRPDDVAAVIRSFGARAVCASLISQSYDRYADPSADVQGTRGSTRCARASSRASRRQMRSRTSTYEAHSPSALATPPSSRPTCQMTPRARGSPRAPSRTR